MCKSKKLDKKGLFNSYLYEYKLISFEELNDKILNGEDFFYTVCNEQNYTFEIFDNPAAENLFSWSPEKYAGESWFIPNDLIELTKTLNK